MTTVTANEEQTPALVSPGARLAALFAIRDVETQVNQSAGETWAASHLRCWLKWGDAWLKVSR